VTVIRKEIKLPAVTSSLLDKETGYIRILSFSETAGEEFDLELAKLQRQGIRTLVIDLRGDGGGIMDSALHIADRFLSSGLIVQLKERQSEYRINADPESVDMPLAILIDGGSASASELLAGSLQANKKAKLVGQRSFGKGVSQTAMQLKNGDFLKFTFGQFFFADGTSPQGKGLKPDVTIGIPELQTAAAIQAVHPERGKSVRFDLTNQKMFVGETEVPNRKIRSKNGQIYLPLRVVVEGFGSEVMWNPNEQTVSFHYKDRFSKLSAATGSMVVNDQKVDRIEPFFVEEGVSYISLEALQDALHPETVRKTANLIEISDK
jgi:carboxyl-terminal processing protease